MKMEAQIQMINIASIVPKKFQTIEKSNYENYRKIMLQQYLSPPNT